MSAIALPTSLGPSAFEPNPRSDRALTPASNNPADKTASRRSTAPTPGSSANSADTLAATGRAGDSVSLSPEAQQATTSAVQGSTEPADTLGKTANREDPQNTTADSTKPRGKDGEPLTDEEVKQVDQLKARDAEVRRHEQAHVAAGGPYVTSGPTYEYQQGPDGKRYAVGGSVGIDTSAEDTPEKTITKAQTIRRAALAPAEPSSQDRRVAAQASQMEQQARAELAEERRTEQQAPQGEQSEPPAANDADATASTSPASPSGVPQQLEQAYASTSAQPSTFSTTA